MIARSCKEANEVKEEMIVHKWNCVYEMNWIELSTIQ